MAAIPDRDFRAQLTGDGFLTGGCFDYPKPAVTEILADDHPN